MEHPDITKAISTGYPHDEPDRYYCPVCKTDLDADDTVYTVTAKGIIKVIGCSTCIETRTAEGVYA